MVLKGVVISLYVFIFISLIIYLIKDICKCTRIGNEVGRIIERCGEVAKEVEREQLERLRGK